MRGEGLVGKDVIFHASGGGGGGPFGSELHLFLRKSRDGGGGMMEKHGLFRVFPNP